MQSSKRTNEGVQRSKTEQLFYAQGPVWGMWETVFFTGQYISLCYNHSISIDPRY